MMVGRRHWALLWIAAAAYSVVHLLWARPLAWDEVEFFRAARWMGLGRVPYRDFWEHHLPLQWMLFAPVARFVDSPGSAAIVIMRWAQVPLWIATCSLLFRLGRAGGRDRSALSVAMLVLLASPLFIETAVEYRVDVVANLAFLGALFLALTRAESRWAWIAFGALGSAAVLANIRLVYLVVPVTVVCALADTRGQRWRFNPRAGWLIAGVVAVAGPFVLWLSGTGAMPEFEAAMRLNVAGDRILAREANTLLPLLLQPLKRLDLAAILLIAGACAGAAAVIPGWRTPDAMHVLGITAALSFVSVVMLGIHYPYHLQLTLLLLVPLAAAAIRGPRTRTGGVVAAASVLVLALLSLTWIGTYHAMRYQDTVMREVDRRTTPGERVFDGLGSALRREPAYRYWFLPSIVRLAAHRGLVERYDVRDMLKAPPAAIVHSIRINQWLRQFPEENAYSVRHYLPLYRDLWLPALSAPLRPGATARWIAPRNGRYRIVAADLLLKHPWFYNPLNYALMAGSDDTDYSITLAAVPAADRSRLQLFVEGKVVTAPVFDLKRGDGVALRSRLDAPVGVLIVPADWSRVFISPPGPVVM